MSKMKDLKIKLFADGADINSIIKNYQCGMFQGLTTNPTLMSAAGITDYKQFALEVLSIVKDIPVSFEVTSDDLDIMELEAIEIAGWADNVYVKIPITTTDGKSTEKVIANLSKNHNIKVNVTAILTLEQVEIAAKALSDKTLSVISVFAGRIADTGRDPVPYMVEAKKIMSSKPNIELLWASSRELFNVFQAQQSGCDIITITDSIISRFGFIGKDLQELSLDTVNMFYNDIKKTGYVIPYKEKCHVEI